MKKLLIFLICLMMVSPALAAPVPQPISVKIITNIGPMENLDVTITDVTTGTTKMFKTNTYGEIMLDAYDDMGIASANGHPFKAVVETCKDKATCTQQLTFSESVFFNFDLTTTKCFECPTCPECQTYTLAGLVALLVAAIFVVGKFMGGIQFYRKNDGTIGIKHKHTGVIGYHDINLSHSNVKYRHPRGQWAPKYDANGNYVGGVI